MLTLMRSLDHEKMFRKLRTNEAKTNGFGQKADNAAFKAAKLIYHLFFSSLTHYYWGNISRSQAAVDNSQIQF